MTKLRLLSVLSATAALIMGIISFILCLREETPIMVNSSLTATTISGIVLAIFALVLSIDAELQKDNKLRTISGAFFVAVTIIIAYVLIAYGLNEIKKTNAPDLVLFSTLMILISGIFRFFERINSMFYPPEKRYHERI
ncbi:MAG: hypothetical protein WCO07_01260 [bacterium]